MKAKTAMFASRTNWKLTPNQITERFQAIQKEGKKVLNLIESNPTHCHFKYLNEKLLLPFADSTNLKYEPSPKGMLETRTAIKNYYLKKGIKLDPEQIFLVASTSEAYSSIFRLLINPGERVLIPQPSYPLFNFLADINDTALDPYALSYDQKWQINIGALVQAYRPETKAITLVHPNNPTGSFVKQKEFFEIEKIAQNHSLALICDEVFSDYAFCEDQDRFGSLAQRQGVLTFTLGGISKTLGLPQMKLAWIVVNGPEEILNETSKRLEVISDTYLSVSTPIQKSLPSWFALQPLIQEEITQRLKQNLAFLSQSLSGSHPCSSLDTEGGWYVTLRLPRTKTEEEWVLEFLEKDYVFVHPGYFFDFAEEAYVVLSLLPLPEIFQEGIMRILNRAR